MMLSRKFLRELNLPREMMDRILAAYRESTDALRREANQARAQRDEAARIQREFDEFKEKLEGERVLGARREAVKAALLEAGANPEVLPLLVGAVPLEGEGWEGERMRDAAEMVGPVVAEFGGCFARAVAVPTPAVAPPVAVHGPLTREDVGRMSETEILANWGAVQSALRGF